MQIWMRIRSITRRKSAILNSAKHQFLRKLTGVAFPSVSTKKRSSHLNVTDLDMPMSSHKAQAAIYVASLIMFSSEDLRTDALLIEKPRQVVYYAKKTFHSSNRYDLRVKSLYADFYYRLQALPEDRASWFIRGLSDVGIRSPAARNVVDSFQHHP